MTIENAIKLMQTKQFAKAKDICYEIIASGSEKQRAYFILASISERQNQDAEALKYLDQALAIGTPKPGILRKYGQILSRQLKPELAIEKYNAALKLNRTKPILLELGHALIASNNPEKAKVIFEEALVLDKNCIDSLHQLGRMAYVEDETDKFIGYVEQERKLEPRNPRLIVTLLMTYLETSALQKALALCDEGLSIYPELSPLYAMKYIVLAEKGELEAAMNIMDFDSLLKLIPANCPNEYTDINVLNNELVDHTLNRAMKATNQESYTTRFGWQTEHGKLFKNNVELGAIVEKMVEDAVQEYISILPNDSSHPVNIIRPKEYSIESWCVVLNTNGHQAPHIHPSAWLSGVYYVKLPEDFDQQNTPDAGHIVFGKGKEGLHHVDAPDTLTIKPVEGKFVMFPSYFWHHTIPLESKFERICLAFNVVPKSLES